MFSLQNFLFMTAVIRALPAACMCVEKPIIKVQTFQQVGLRGGPFLPASFLSGAVTAVYH